MTELTVNRIFEMRGSGQILQGGVASPRKVQVDMSFGTATLREGAYLIEVNEEIEVPEGETGIIRSLPDLGTVGAFVPTRTVGEGAHEELQIALICSRTVELELDAPIASLSIEDSLDVEALEERIDEKTQSIARYLKAGGVDNLP